jgi:ComEC/Rec2-related protein
MRLLPPQSTSFRLAYAASALIAGEAAGFAVPHAACAWQWLAGASALALTTAWGWGMNRLWWAAIFATGLVLALRTEERLTRTLDENTGIYGPRRPMELRVDGNVSEPRRQKNGELRIFFASHSGPMPLTVAIPARQGAPHPRTGETWAIDGAISWRTDEAKRYDRRTIWARGPNSARRVAEAAPWNPSAQWESVGAELARRAGAGLEWNEELAALNRAILLGHRADLPKELRRMFADAGTIHVFAISGLHVMMVAYFLKTVLMRLDVPEGARGLICLPLIAAYVTLTGARPSAVRAALMAALMLTAPTFGRKPDALAAWSATALVVYGLSPERLFDIGCSLSFTVMLGIVLWLKWSQRLSPWFRPESPAARLFSGLGVSFAAWIAGVPITAHVFGRFTPGGLLANIVVMACAQLMVKTGMGALAASLICLPLAALLNNLAATFTWAMTFTSRCVAALPGATIEVEPWTSGTCIAWYAAWTAAFLLIGRLLPRNTIAPRRWW